MPVQDAQSGARLHDETLSELGLTEQPFLEDKKRQPAADSINHATRGALEQHVRFGRSLHLLIGEQGSGKTTLLQQLLKHCKNSIKPFVVKGSEAFQAAALLHVVLNDLSTAEEVEEDSIEGYVESLTPIFDQITADRLVPLLIIDDAHLAPIKEIALLVDTLKSFENEDGATARLLLTGTPALLQSINHFEAQFADLNLQYSTTEMQPFDEAHTREYLSARLHQTGFADTFPFTDKAIGKIQRESGGLPGPINESASHYLNGVYSSSSAGSSKAGWLSSVEWPVLAIGAAALAAIGLGLSMFFGSKPETEVISLAANENNTQIEQVIEQELPVVEPTSVNNTTPSDALLLDSSTDTESVTLPTSDPATNDPATNDLASNDSTIDSMEAPELSGSLTSLPVEPQATETVISVEAPTALVLPDVTEVQNDVDQTIGNSVSIGATDGEQVEVTRPTTQDTQDLAANKSIANIDTDQSSTDLLSDNNLLTDTVPADLNQNNGTSNSDSFNTADNSEANSAPVEADTDAIGAAPIDNTSDAEQETNPAVIAPRSDRAVENERWVLFQSPLKFTVQLATSRDREYIIDLAKTMDLRDPVAIYPFLTTNSNNPVFGLLSGLHDTRTDAIQAVENMSEEAKKFGVWIRPVSDLQADIKRRK